ncbi:hypothetical protein A0O32_0861 [Anoxybacillus flavithermus]|nr:hypothetical protein A0O32_0861 [Anoxybacillus flavithermus]
MRARVQLWQKDSVTEEIKPTKHKFFIHHYFTHRSIFTIGNNRSSLCDIAHTTKTVLRTSIPYQLEKQRPKTFYKKTDFKKLFCVERATDARTFRFISISLHLPFRSFVLVVALKNVPLCEMSQTFPMIFVTRSRKVMIYVTASQ